MSTILFVYEREVGCNPFCTYAWKGGGVWLMRTLAYKGGGGWTGSFVRTQNEFWLGLKNNLIWTTMTTALVWWSINQFKAGHGVVLKVRSLTERAGTASLPLTVLTLLVKKITELISCIRIMEGQKRYDSFVQAFRDANPEIHLEIRTTRLYMILELHNINNNY